MIERRKLIFATFSLIGTVLPLTATQAQPRPEPGYREPPPNRPPPGRPPMPPPRHEARPPPPGRPVDWRWRSGRWSWDGRRWVWVSGRWYH
jgi:hypothetical protein